MMVRRLLLLIVTAAMTACAPGLGTKLRVPPLPEKDIQPLQLASGFSIRTHVGRFTDARQPLTIGEINGRLLDAQGDVGAIVQRGFERHLALAGVRLALFDAAVITGDVTKWYVTVRTGFPVSSVYAVASLEVSLFDKHNALTYKATYSGETREENPWLTEAKIQNILGTAMSYAIREALNDRRLVEKLATM